MGLSKAKAVVSNRSIASLHTKLVNQCIICAIDDAVSVAIFSPFVHIALHGKFRTGSVLGT